MAVEHVETPPGFWDVELPTWGHPQLGNVWCVWLFPTFTDKLGSLEVVSSSISLFYFNLFESQSTDFRSLFHPQQPWRHLETKSLVSEAGWWQPWTWTFWGARWSSQRTQNDGLGPRGNQRKIPGVAQCHILVTVNNTFFQLNCAWKMAQDLGWAVKL